VCCGVITLCVRRMLAVGIVIVRCTCRCKNVALVTCLPQFCNIVSMRCVAPNRDHRRSLPRRARCLHVRPAAMLRP
jgi:hypothetical protein